MAGVLSISGEIVESPEVIVTDFATFLAAFNAEDFATETTLSALKAAFDATDFATQTTLQALLTAFNAEDFATETTLQAVLAALAASTGSFGYHAGISGTVNITGTDARVTHISATAGAVAATITIDGGDTITIPPGRNFGLPVEDNKLVDPNIIFTNTTSYFVGFIQ